MEDFIRKELINVKETINKFHPNCKDIVRPRVVDLLFIVTRAHQKIKALFCRINFDYATNFVKKRFIFLSNIFLLSIEKKRKIHTKHDHASKFNLTSI